MKNSGEEIFRPDYLGTLPIREDITFLPTDIPDSVKLSFFIKETSGMPISSTPPGVEETEIQKILDSGLWPRDAIGELQFFPITDQDQLKIGQELLFLGIMGGYCLAVVTEITGDKAVAESEYLLYWLHFGKDEDHCWTCWGQASQNALKTIEFK